MKRDSTPVILDRALLIEAFEQGQSDNRTIILKPQHGERRAGRLETNLLFQADVVDGSEDSVLDFFMRCQTSTQTQGSEINYWYRYSFYVPFTSSDAPAATKTHHHERLKVEDKFNLIQTEKKNLIESVDKAMQTEEDRMDALKVSTDIMVEKLGEIMTKLKNDPLTAILIGQTGSGKSSLARLFTGTNKFTVFHNDHVITTQCDANSKKGSHFLGIDDLPEVQMIDTPGLGNGEKCKDENGKKVTDAMITIGIRKYLQATSQQNNDDIAAIIWVQKAIVWQKKKVNVTLKGLGIYLRLATKKYVGEVFFLGQT